MPWLSTKWTVSGLLVWSAVLAAVYLWWMYQGPDVITTMEYDDARRSSGSRDGLLGLLVANNLTAPTISVDPYPRIFGKHSSSAVLSQNLKSRCNLYFSRWRQPPVSADDVWVFESFSDFKRNPRVKQLYGFPVPEESNYGYLEFAQKLYGDAIKERQLQEETLAMLLSGIRVYHQCYLRQNGQFLKRQYQRIARIKDRIDLGSEDSLQYTQLKLEQAIFPWLTGVVPKSSTTNVVSSMSRVRMSNDGMGLAKVMSLWSGKGIVVLDNDDTEAIISHIRQQSDLPIQIITNSSDTKTYGFNIEILNIGDSYRDVDLLPLVAAFFSTFAHVIVVTSPKVSIDALHDLHYEGEMQRITPGRLWSQLRPSRYEEVMFGLNARSLPSKQPQPLVIHINKSKHVEVLLLSIELQRQPATQLLVGGNEMWWGQLVSSV